MKKLALVLVVASRRCSRSPRRDRAPARATSRSTATAGSSRPATGSTSSTCSTWPRSRPSRRSRRWRPTARRGTRPGSPDDRRGTSTLTVDGRRVALAPDRAACSPSRRARRAAHDPPRDRLPRPRAAEARARIAYRDANYPGRIGWKEIVVAAEAGARLLASSVPAKSVSAELLAYPKNLLQSPLDVDSAPRQRRARARPPARRPTLLPRTVLDQRAAVRAVADGGFA